MDNQGWFTVLLGLVLFSVMWAWHSARKIKNRYVKFVEIEQYYDIIKELSDDESVPKYSSKSGTACALALPGRFP